MSALFELFCARRGLSAQSLIEMERPAIGELPGMEAMQERLRAVRESGDQIVVVPDFDCDGVSSGVLGLAGLRELGFNAALFVPDPACGYGFGAQEAARLLRERPQARHVITCDVGLSERAGAEALAAAGVEYLVTDHHQCVEGDSEAVARIAGAVCAPFTVTGEAAFTGICGAHVLWQVLMRFARESSDPARVSQIDRLRVFAGMGTMSDSMPLLHENRRLVRDACDIARLVWSGGERDFVDGIAGTQAYRNAVSGLFELLGALDGAGKLKGDDAFGEDLLAFYIGPMVNSPRRLGMSVRAAFDVFCLDSEQLRADAALRLLGANERRKELTDELCARALADGGPWAPRIYVTDVPAGMCGLVATRLMREGDGGPTIVLRRGADGTLDGSARGPEWYGMRSRVLPHVQAARGHESAFGVSVASDAQLDELFEWMSDDWERAQEGAGQAASEVADIRLAMAGEAAGADARPDVPALLELCGELEALAPYGPGFERPRVSMRFAPGEAEWARIGSESQHLRLRFPNGFEILSWNAAARQRELMAMPAVECAGRLERSSFRGSLKVSLQGDLRQAAP